MVVINCEFCGNIFQNGASLRRHKNMKHNNTSPVSSNNPTSSNNPLASEMRYCDVCSLNVAKLVAPLTHQLA